MQNLKKMYVHDLLYFTAATQTRRGAIKRGIGLAGPFQARPKPSKFIVGLLMKGLQLIATRQNLSDFMKYFVLTTTFNHISSFPLNFAAINKKKEKIE